MKTETGKSFNLENIVWREGKYFVAQCLNADISSFGTTKKEALANLREALELYCEDVRGKPHRFLKVEKPEIVSTFLQYA